MSTQLPTALPNDVAIAMPLVQTKRTEASAAGLRVAARAPFMDGFAEHMEIAFIAVLTASALLLGAAFVRCALGGDLARILSGGLTIGAVATGCGSLLSIGLGLTQLYRRRTPGS